MIQQTETPSMQEPLLVVDEAHNDEERPRSRNIPLVLLYTGFAFAGRSLWSQSVLSTFVFLLRNDNPEAVGLITAVMGMSQLLASFPTGVLADRHGRDLFLKASSFVGLVAVGVTLFSVHCESYQWLVVALAVWGLYWGIASTSLSALYADSVHDGDRSYYFTRRSIVMKAGNTVGPIVALVLFALLGDHWTIRDCAIVMSAAQILCLPAIVLLCLLSDKHAVDDVHDEQSDTEALLMEDGSTGSENDVDTSENETSLDSEESTPSAKTCCCLSEHRVIPVLISLADVTSGLGSGMSIRYFPIFFMDNLSLSPVVVQILFVLSPLGQALLMHVGQVWAKRLGRCKMAVIFKWIGLLCMMAMIASYLFRLPRWWICVVYLLRTSFMNATYALTKSVLMDAVPKSERGKWSALESVNMFSWSGSAALGGILVGFKGLIFNFCVTAAVQFAATLPLVVLFVTGREGMEGYKGTTENTYEEGAAEDVVDSTDSATQVDSMVRFDTKGKG